MTSPTRRYPLTTDYTKDKLNVRPPRFPERRLVEDLTEAALEGGRPGGEAANIAVGVFKELNLLCRDMTTGDILPLSDLKLVRRFARAVLRSGVDVKPFAVAQRAMAAWKELRSTTSQVHGEVEKEIERERARKKRAGGSTIKPRKSPGGPNER